MAALVFPDATNTGVPVGVTLTPYNGNLVINTPGAVIEGLDINGNVTITADNVTLKNCKVTSSEFWVIGINTDVTGVVIEDCEINGLGTTSNSRGIAGQGTFLRNNIYNVENGINVEGSNTLIQDNYIHDLKASGSPRYDGIQIMGGSSNITVRENTVINSYGGSAVRISNDFGGVSGVVVDNNKLSGGDFIVFSDEKSSYSGQITGVQFTNNYLDKGYNGYAFVANNSVDWQGNIDLDTGLAVAQDGTLTQNSQPAEITVSGNGVSVADGDASPSSADFTNFGSVSQDGAAVVRTFTVRNDGGSTLTLGAPTLPTGFSLVAGDPLVSSLAPGASDTFQVQMSTTSTGTKSGQVSFSNNDSDENPFNFSITGTVNAAATPAEITVSGNGVSVADGDASPSSADFTNFGSVSQDGAAVVRTFTVRNDGGSTLTLGAPTLPTGFSLVAGDPLVSSLAPGASDTFQVQMSTTSTGTKSGQVSFSNNDSDENPFNFSITGTVNAVGPGASTGFPDATNTGVPVGVTLTPYNGNLVINTPGAVIEGLDINGNVTITADNVTLKNCKVTSSEFWVIGINTDVTGVVIEDCEINGLGTTSNSRGIAGQGTFLRNNIYNVENGINVEGSNTLIQDNYIHDLKASGSPRYDGIQIMGGSSNITVRENTVINSYGGSAVRISNDFGGVSGVVVDNNKLSGGDFIVYSDEKSSYSGQITGVQFTNNYLDKGYNGYAFVANNSVDWQGNIDLDTGLAVAQDGTLTQNSQPAEITVSGNGVSVADGDASPSSADFTNFGSVSQDGAAVVRTFTVRNDGGSTLTLGAPTLPTGFSLVAGDPLVSSLAPGASDTFQVQMSTTSTGTKSGQVSFSNNDSDENPFNFSITGTVNAAATPAEITVSGNGVSVADGDASPSSADFTNFGSVSQDGAAVVRTFTVRNDGGSTLTLGAPTLPTGFSLVAGDPLVSSLAPGASDTFQVQMSTTSTGTKSGQVSFSNNDSDENPFNFSITGTVNAAATPAEITVSGNGVSVADGDTSPSSADFTNFGSVSQDGAAVVRTFTVRNDGGSTLTLGAPTLPTGFSLVAGDPLVSSLAPGASDTFQVQMSTTSTGTKSGQVSFSNNDSDENPFNFSITGTVNTGGSTILYATPTNFASQVAAATAGQVIYLASGNYGIWNGTNNAITIAPQDGAAVTMGMNFGTGDSGFTINGTNGSGKINTSGGNITGNANNITIKNCAFTSFLVIDGPINSNILLDNNTHININTTTSSTPAMIHLAYGGSFSGVTVQNSLFQGGNADGIQAGIGLNILNNRFIDIAEHGYDELHTDAIQFYGATGVLCKGNYIYNCADGIVAYDGTADNIIEDNVIDLIDGRYGIELYSDSNSIVRHNTLRWQSGGGAGMGIIALDHKSQDPAGHGTIVENNVCTSVSLSNGSTATVNRNNMVRSGASGQNFNGIPIYVGGAAPTTFADYALASGSPGNGAAFDGLDVGSRVELYAPAGVAGEAINLGLINPTDHLGSITVNISGVPSGWTMSEGSDNGDGTWSVQTNDVSALSATAPVDYTGAVSLQMSQAWTDSMGGIGLAMIANNVEAYAPGAPIVAISGDDNLSGSSGNDVFVLAQPIGNDTIHSFDFAHDKVDLIGFTDLSSFVDVQTRLFDNSNGDAVVTIAGGESITFDGVRAALLRADNFVFNLNTVMDNANSLVIGDNAVLPLAGTVNNSGTIELASIGGQTRLQVLANGLALEGGGHVDLSDGNGNIIVGTTPDATLINVDNTISGAGQLGNGQLTLHNKGTIIASGGNALTIDTGANAVVNSGMLEAIGSGGLVIHSDIANSGVLWANGGNITIDGNVSGTGSALIDGVATFEMGGAFGENVTLDAGANATLKIDHAADFSGTVAGFDGNDVLDLADLSFGSNTTLGYAANSSNTGGTLTVSDGTHTANIALLGQYTAASFVMSADGFGGTLIHDLPPATQTQTLTQPQHA